MKAVIKSDIKNEIKMLQKMIPWLQRGSLERISFVPNHPAIITHFPLNETINSECINARLLKRGRRLFLIIDELEIYEEIQTFQSDSPADALMTYLLEQRPGELVKFINLPDSLHEITGLKLRNVFRKMRHWKAFEHYFMTSNNKQSFRLSNRVILTRLEVKKILGDFKIKWQESEQLN